MSAGKVLGRRAGTPRTRSCHASAAGGKEVAGRAQIPSARAAREDPKASGEGEKETEGYGPSHQVKPENAWRNRAIWQASITTTINLMRIRFLTSFLEPHVLKRLCGVPVQTGSRPVIAPAGGKVAERDPRTRTVAG